MTDIHRRFHSHASPSHILKFPRTPADSHGQKSPKGTPENSPDGAQRNPGTASNMNPSP